MRYMDIGCNVDCCKCSKQCELKSLMETSIRFPYMEPVFYSIVMQYLKAQAGQLIVQGKNFAQVDEDVKELAVSFYVARQIMGEQLYKWHFLKDASMASFLFFIINYF